MYNLNLEFAQKIVGIYNALNQLDVRGMSNLGIVYTSLLELQKIIQELEKQNSMQEIKIDNTKGG